MGDVLKKGVGSIRNKTVLILLTGFLLLSLALYASASIIDGFSEIRYTGDLIINASRLIITNATNNLVMVGIGTTSPGTLLETVGGDVNITNGSDVGLYFDSSENKVGIGTAGPEQLLHITASDPIIYLDGSSAADTAITRTMTGLELSVLGMNTNNKYGSAVKFMSTDTELTTENPKFLAAIVPRATEAYATDASGGMALDFATTPDAPGANNIPLVRMTVDQSGNVGIGTATPDTLLEISNASADIVPYLRISNSGGLTPNITLDLYRNDGDAGIIKLVPGGLGFKIGSTHTSGDIRFYTSSDINLDTNERMIIDQAGKVGIGITAPVENLAVVGNISFSDTATALTGNVNYVTVGSQFVLQKATSSIRFKQNVTNIPDEDISKVLQLNPVAYQRKDSGKNEVGFIAEEVEKINPDWVVYDCVECDKDTTAVPFSVKYQDIGVATLKLVQEQQTQIEFLKSELCKKDGSYSWCKKGLASEQPVQPVNETAPAGETPVEAPVNSVPVIESFMPETVPIMSVGESQEFTINASDADNDQLSLQWFVDDLPVAEQTQASFTFTASEAGVFEVKVLVTDGKDYAVHKWAVTVEQPTEGGFSITGAAVGVISKGSSSLLGWLRSLF